MSNPRLKTSRLPYDEHRVTNNHVGKVHQRCGQLSLAEEWPSAILEDVFSTCFEQKFATKLIGNAQEPFYCAAKKETCVHIIYYRHDYFSSALHEIAHWCIAGEVRRNLDDYGYWYEPDGRNAEQQALFQQVEIKPQAIEMAFSLACNKPFSVSIDNLGLEENLSEECGVGLSEEPFAQAVNVQYQDYCNTGFPPRAAIFLKALKTVFSSSSNKARAELAASLFTISSEGI